MGVRNGGWSLLENNTAFMQPHPPTLVEEGPVQFHMIADGTSYRHVHGENRVDSLLHSKANSRARNPIWGGSKRLYLCCPNPDPPAACAPCQLSIGCAACQDTGLEDCRVKADWEGEYGPGGKGTSLELASLIPH